MKLQLFSKRGIKVEEYTNLNAITDKDIKRLTNQANREYRTECTYKIIKNNN